MKKFYSLLLLASSIAFAQTPIITGIMDGDCTGGNPKAVEIYASGTVDFSNYALENQTNSNDTWGNTLNLGSFGTVTDDFIYIVNADDNSAFYSEFADIPSEKILYTSTDSGEPKPLNINGDDRLRIIDAGNSNVIDQYGVEATDGTDSAWEFKDSWAVRKDGTGPDGANFNIDNWTFGGVVDGTGSLDGFGLCQESDAFSTIVPFGEYSETLSSNIFQNSNLKIFPNPLSGNILNITSDKNSEKQVVIYDILGKQVINTVVKNGTVNVSNLTSGVYIVKITEEGKTATRKLVVK